jgi:hypothetical protein
MLMTVPLNDMLKLTPLTPPMPPMGAPSSSTSKEIILPATGDFDGQPHHMTNVIIMDHLANVIIMVDVVACQQSACLRLMLCSHVHTPLPSIGIGPKSVNKPL